MDNDDNKVGEVYDGPMVKVHFVKEYEIINEHGEKTGEVVQPGTEMEIPEPTVASLVEGGFAEVVDGTDSNDSEDVEEASPESEEEGSDELADEADDSEDEEV